MAIRQELPASRRCFCSRKVARFTYYLLCPLPGRMDRSEACVHAAVSRWRLIGIREFCDPRRYPVTAEGGLRFVIAMGLSKSICAGVKPCVSTLQISIRNQEKGIEERPGDGKHGFNERQSLFGISTNSIAMRRGSSFRRQFSCA